MVYTHYTQGAGTAGIMRYVKVKHVCEMINSTPSAILLTELSVDLIEEANNN